MARWEYDLKTMGKNLREYIDECDSSKEHCETVLGQVVVCCKYLLENLSSRDKEWYETDLDELIQDCEDAKYYLDEYDYESNSDNVDDVLTTFYDLMDSIGVWVGF